MEGRPQSDDTNAHKGQISGGPVSDKSSFIGSRETGPKSRFPGGLLVAIEGIDGAGKSIQARAVTEILTARGLDCVATREPTNGPWGTRLRESAVKGRLSPAEELHAFIEDRKQHVAELIRPSLDAGRVVITDRYYFSTVAYQGALGFDPGDLLRQNEAFAIKPHLLVILDLRPEVSLARVGSRDGRTNEFETIAQLRKCREIFLSQSAPYRVVLDASAAPQELTARILFELSRAAWDSLARNSTISPQTKLEALLAFHGMSTALNASP